MTPEQFTDWLEDMKDSQLARTDADCGRLLKVSANSIVTMKKKGACHRTALACSALLHRLKPYGEE